MFGYNYSEQLTKDFWFGAILKQCDSLSDLLVDVSHILGYITHWYCQAVAEILNVKFLRAPRSQDQLWHRWKVSQVDRHDIDLIGLMHRRKGSHYSGLTTGDRVFVLCLRNLSLCNFCLEQSLFSWLLQEAGLNAVDGERIRNRQLKDDLHRVGRGIFVDLGDQKIAKTLGNVYVESYLFLRKVCLSLCINDSDLSLFFVTFLSFSFLGNYFLKVGFDLSWVERVWLWFHFNL